MARAHCPRYIAEIAPPDVRGSLVAAKEAFIVLGMVFAFGMLAIVESAGVAEANQWRFTWAAPFPFAVAVIGIMSVAPYSPRWLLKQKRTAEAREAMRYLLPGMDEATISQEMSTVEATLHDEVASLGGGESARKAACFCCDDSEKRQWSLLCSARRPLLVGTMVVTLQQVTGQPTVLYYAQRIFLDAGFSVSNSKVSDLVIGAAKLAATLVSVGLVDRLGRRTLLFIGTSMMLVALLALAVSFSNGDSSMNGAVVITALMVYVSGYQVGFGPMTWLLISELFPLHSRSRAISLCVIVNFALNLLITLTNAPLQEAIGQCALFSFFATMCALSLALMYVFVPETKGKTLEEIEAMMGTHPSSTKSDP
jgi:sugar porter (SP) family MFS transporter